MGLIDGKGGGISWGGSSLSAGKLKDYVIDPLDLLGIRKGEEAAQKQLDAQKEALAQNTAQVEATRKQLGGLTDQARKDVGGYTSLADQALASQYGQAQGYMGQATGALGGSQGLADYARGATTAVDSRIAPVDMASDPGVEFRRQQGEQALLNSQSAKGGRFSPAAMQELMAYNSGLASQEYGNAFNRNAQQTGLNMQAGLAAQGNQAGMASTLANMYGNQGQMAQQQGGSLAGLYSQTGANLGNLSTSMAGNYTDLTQAMMQAQQNYAQYPGMVEQSHANKNGQMVGVVGNVFGGLLGKMSDVRLKTNLEIIPSKYNKIGLRGYRWKWNETAEKLGLRGSSEGVIAQDLLPIIPDAVSMGADGWLCVNYGLLDSMVEG